MKITVLTYLEKEGDKEHDIVVDQVAAALKKGGHTVSTLGVHGDVKKLIAGLQKQEPELVFNLMEMFNGNIFGDVDVAGLLDLMGLAFTGCGPGELYISQDKALTKKMLSFEGLSYPNFAVFTKDADLETGGNLRMPLFVKPLRGDASIGIDTDSLVHDANDMMKRVNQIHEKILDAALAEEYVDGREFYVGVLGNYNPTVFPVIEMDFSGLPQGRPKFLDRRAKFDEDSAEYRGTRAILAELAPELKAKLQTVALEAYRALRVRDYGRVDLRYTPSGQIYVLEVNPSCYLEKDSEFATAAKALGIEFDVLVQRIVELALERHRRKKV
jgi:D-alanine-D-alanine ligase